MLEILGDVWHHIKSLKPAFISRTPHFNFITVHYFWIIGMALTGSVCLYSNGAIHYIDALFLGTGAATQSGLNTIDINLLTTWQQIVLYIVPMLTNPITVNTFVVFLRLYWFEKRFQHIANEAKKSRRSIAKTVSRARSTDRDVGDEERGINGRSIIVMHNNTKPNNTMSEADIQDAIDPLDKGEPISAEKNAHSRSSKESGDTSNAQSTASEADPEQDSLRPQITFDPQVKRSDGLSDEDLRMPSQRSAEDHIAFLQRQRNRDDDAVLRIPGPRDADAGIAPQAVDEHDPATRIFSRRESGLSKDNKIQRPSEDEHSQPLPRRRGITIAEPPRPPTTQHVAEDAIAAKHTVGALRLRKPGFLKRKDKTDDDNSLHPVRSRVPTLHSLKQAWSSSKDEGMPYLSWEATVGRNSAFVDLTEEQREELGGVEYRSLKSLALILVCYFWGFSIFALVSLLPWIWNNPTYGSIVTSVGQGRSWWALFTANSAFTDLGFTLTPDSMISFRAARWPLVVMSFLIIIGNTGFPIMLRIIIWVTSKWVPKDSGIWEELKFLLDHPRRCFTLLFPSKATWWLFWILVGLNGLDLVLFIILDLNNPVVTELPVNIRVLDGWFQAVSTRTAGLAVVNLAELHPGIQVSYLVMMYISVLPIAISVRRTNVYEEKSLGIYSNPSDEQQDEGEPSYVGAHLRRQLSFDLWYIFLGLFIIAIAEGSRLPSGDIAFTMFSVLFEIVSAYGTVGLSLGYTGINASFSAEFGVISKLVIIAMQIRGRHRGLPYELDRAILLPSEHLQKKEAADATLRAHRRSSANLAPTASGASRNPERSRSRNRSVERSASNFLSSMLHPGPTIPNSHRNIHREDPSYQTDPTTTNKTTKRRHSFATTGIRGRGESPHGNPFFTNFFSGGGDGTTEESPARKPEGRRHFYQEGVNPSPAPVPAENILPTKESKQA